MVLRTLSRLCAILVFGGLCIAAVNGQPPQSLPPPTVPVPSRELPTVLPGEAIPIIQNVKPGDPKPATVEELIERLADLKRQKTELDRQEQAVIKSLRERLRDQKDRLIKLGVAEDQAPGATEIAPPPTKPEQKK